MMTALITGSDGQDGHYLSSLLATKGYRVIGVGHGSPLVNLLDPASVFALLQRDPPQEIYHLAAYHHSAQDKLADDLEIFTGSNAVHVQATAHLLEAMRRHCPKARLFFAGSCHIYGSVTTPRQDESTPFHPEGIYAITKCAGIELCRFYRRKHGLFTAIGILYNHESPLRSLSFVSRKVVEAAVAISRREQTALVLGDLDAEVDWGFAGDYASAMHQILQLDLPDDFVISSGEHHSVREFVDLAFRQLGLDWTQHVRVDPGLLRGLSRSTLFGDSSKLQRLTGWRPATGFAELVRLMVTAELERHGNR
ncbi:MAG TPA: GDP-mannose 4,6-dehydratase [Verrucomicrobiae bacterium]|nr:GDP-mannose 4,6-dehydratase [Verrucomicrobiae bacterium]